jgi:hypothetical protein
LEQLQKVIKYPLEQMACRIRKLHADNAGNIPLRELNFKFKKKKQVLKFGLTSMVFVLVKVNPTIPL